MQTHIPDSHLETHLFFMCPTPLSLFALCGCMMLLQLQDLLISFPAVCFPTALTIFRSLYRQTRLLSSSSALGITGNFFKLLIKLRMQNFLPHEGGKLILACLASAFSIVLAKNISKPHICALNLLSVTHCKA